MVLSGGGHYLSEPIFQSRQIYYKHRRQLEPLDFAASSQAKPWTKRKNVEGTLVL